MSSAVRLAAMIPARRGVASTSPFLALPDTIRSSVALLITIYPSAPAVRSVAALADTSTIRASPLASIWVRAALFSADVALADVVLDGRCAMFQRVLVALT